MEKRRRFGKKQIRIGVLNALLCAMVLAGTVGLVWLSGLLDAQKAATRWQGESEREFNQLSCFIPSEKLISLEDVYAFRYAMLDKFHSAALDVDNNDTLFVDAWSTSGKAVASTSLGTGDVSITAVGGEYFTFHPIRLLSGSYLTEEDLMKDRVLLDEDVAWLLFGGTDLTGLELRINNVPFLVGGVVRREQDFASRKAYQDGMGLFMSYDAYKELQPEAGINCYELVMAEPVKGFSVNFAREKFPIGDGVILENTGRFSAGRLLGLLKQFGTRSMQDRSIRYPYWENAARCVEDWSMLLLLMTMLAAILPALCLILWLIRRLRRGRDKLSEDLLPGWKDKAEEAIRVRQRRRWEKKHGYPSD